MAAALPQPGRVPHHVVQGVRRRVELSVRIPPLALGSPASLLAQVLQIGQIGLALGAPGALGLAALGEERGRRSRGAVTTRMIAPSPANWLLRTTVIITTDDMTPATGSSEIATLPIFPSGRLGGASMVRGRTDSSGRVLRAGRWTIRRVTGGVLRSGS